MPTTRGNLAPAMIYDLKQGKSSGIACMFNPYEYKVSKQNSYAEKPANRSTTPHFEFSKSGPQTLSLSLLFDTFESGQDVSVVTNQLWKLMEPKTDTGGKQKEPPPEVAFEWGVFRFQAVITSMTQTFTLFQKDGTPVRAKVDVTFTQHVDENDYPRQNPTSGGGPLRRLWVVRAGERLDAIAAETLGSAARWRQIAEANGLSNPLALRPGQQLAIPEE